MPNNFLNLLGQAPMGANMGSLNSGQTQAPTQQPMNLTQLPTGRQPIAQSTPALPVTSELQDIIKLNFSLIRKKVMERHSRQENMKRFLIKSFSTSLGL